MSDMTEQRLREIEEQALKLATDQREPILELIAECRRLRAMTEARPVAPSTIYHECIPLRLVFGCFHVCKDWNDATHVISMPLPPSPKTEVEG